MRKHEHSTMRTFAGRGRFEVDTVVPVSEARRLKMPSDGLANNSVRPSLFSGTKHPSACGQLEGRLGTENGRDHLAGSFIPPRDPLGPLPPLLPNLPQFYALTVLRGAAF